MTTRRFLASLTVAAAIAATAVTVPFANAADPETLTVYTYDSFTSEWGPGPKVQAGFEAKCGCKIQWVPVEDGVALLTRLRLEGASSKADVVLGLDTNLTSEAAATGLFAPHGMANVKYDLPVAWDDEVFIPYDWGYFAFVYDSTKLANPPRSLAELADSDPSLKVIIQDPRTSTPGLGLLLWVKEVYGDQAPAFWAKLAPHILTVTKGWSEAYGMFLKGEAPMVLSYTTSPAYHEIEEQKDTIKAAGFAEGQYMQVEVAAKLKTAPHQALADAFLAYMLTAGFQDVIPTANWMYPAVAGAPLPDAFDKLVRPTKSLLMPPAEVEKNRARWIAEWQEALSR